MGTLLTIVLTIYWFKNIILKLNNYLNELLC